jgi:transcriptional regulator with XRE-family HTH domain
MIQQPELGRKIADLRKEIGLTQEELVEKCNLSVRTLQRIESGDVTPRPYTIKLIFKALELSADNSFEKLFNNNKGLILKWLEQFYISFIDLFNLKTNTMKKISILTVILSLIIFAIIMANSEIEEQKSEKKQSAETEDTNKVYVTHLEMFWTDFSCEECFEENGLLIGRNVKFNYLGTYVDVKLISLNKMTREFNVGFTKGIFREYGIEISIEKDLLKDNLVKYSAEKMKKSNNNIFLTGKAKITYKYDTKIGTIETHEIVITLI